MHCTVYPRGVLFEIETAFEYYNWFGRLIVTTQLQPPQLCQKMQPLFELPLSTAEYAVIKRVLLCVGQEYHKRKKSVNLRPVCRASTFYDYNETAQMTVYTRGILVKQHESCYYWTFFGELLYSSDKYEPPFIAQMKTVAGPFEINYIEWMRINQIMNCIRAEEIRLNALEMARKNKS